jgi:hypothetical protein
MLETDPRLAEALERFDAANAADPAGRELDYGRRMSAWLERIAPDASVPLRLAVRAQHIERWRIPRADYPDGRQGYKRWRSDLARLHAEVAGAILETVGYPDDTVARVGDLIQKRRLSSDPEAQALEDTACLVFLDHYLTDFAVKHPEDKVVDILRKTWNKMSERGRALALELELAEHLAALVRRALA